MHGSVVEFVCPVAQAIVQELQRPHGVFLGVNTGGHLAHVLRDLGVSRETVDELGAGSKKPFAYGSKAWLSGWPSFLDAFVAREQRLEVDAFDSLPPSATRICGSRPWRRTHSRRTIMQDR